MLKNSEVKLAGRSIPVCKAREEEGGSCVP